MGFLGPQNLRANTEDGPRQARMVGHSISTPRVPIPRPEWTRGKGTVSEAWVGGDKTGAAAKGHCLPAGTLKEELRVSTFLQCPHWPKPWEPESTGAS